MVMFPAAWWGMQNGYVNKTATVASFGADVSGISSFVTTDGMRHIFALEV